jgi:hypothetical protein
MTELPSKQPDDQRSEAERQLEYQMAGLEVEVARLTAVNKRLEQALRAAGRVHEPYYVKRSAA